MWAQDTFKPDPAAEKLKADFRLYDHNCQWLACETMIALRTASGTARGPVPMSVLFAHLWPLFYANPSASMENFLVAFERNGLVNYEFAEVETMPEDTSTQGRLLRHALDLRSPHSDLCRSGHSPAIIDSVVLHRHGLVVIGVDTFSPNGDFKNGAHDYRYDRRDCGIPACRFGHGSAGCSQIE